MFCPGCGKPNSTDQKFCRACGMNLEQSASSLLEQFPNNERLQLQGQEKMLERFGQIAFTGFGIVIGIAVLGIIYVIMEKMILSGTQPLSGVLLVAFIDFAGLSLGYVFWSESLKEKRARIEKAPGLADSIRVPHSYPTGQAFGPLRASPKIRRTN